jgi:zinc protease
LERRLFGRHPYSRDPSGQVEDLDAMTVDDLKAWWGRFARPDDAALIFAGDVEANRAGALAAKVLGGWKATGDRPKVEVPDPPAAEPTHIFLVDRPGTAQSQIRVGRLAIGRTHPDFFTTEVIDGYFGSGFTARLNRTLRVQKGLTYGIRGGYDAGRLAGRFTVGTFSKNATTAEAVRTILAEIERLKAEGPSSEELSHVRSSILGGFAGGRETPQAVAADLWLIESEHLPADYYERMLARVAATTADDCLRVVRQTIDPSKLVIVVVGDAKALEADLAKIAPVTVVGGAKAVGGETKPAERKAA